MSLQPFTHDELAEWVDAEYEALCIEERRGYELQPGEITVATFAAATGKPEKTARHIVDRMIKAGKLAARFETIDGRRIKIMTRVG